MRAALKASSYLVKVRDNHSLTSETRIEAGIIIDEWRTNSENEGLRNRIHEFLSEHSLAYVQHYMDQLHQRDIDGSHLYIRGENDCLTVSRGRLSDPIIDRIEGDWTENEKRIAKYLYQFTEAAKR